MPTPPLDLQIRSVNPADPAEMAAFQDVYERAERTEFADADVYTLADAMAVLTRAPLGTFYRGHVAYADSRMVGESLLMGSTVDNLQSAAYWVWVAPEARRRGVGRALAEHVIEESRGMGRHILQSRAKYAADRRADHPYRRFAESLGFTLANTEIERRLPLPTPPGLLDDLAARSAPHHRDYRIHPLVGPIPAELAQGYCDVQNRLMLDAPSGDLVVELRRRTPDILADQDVEIAESGRTRVSAFATDPAGTVVALTSSAASAPGEPGVNQWSTIVRADHRGHRLGMAVKVEQLRTIQQRFPDKRFVTTTNAETNAQMVAINEALGFRQRAVVGEFQLVLAAQPVPSTPPVRSAQGGDPVAQQGSPGVA